MLSKYFWYIFLLVCLGQLAVPLYTIIEKEYILSQGQIFNFRCAPVDPTDPLRGKYIDLLFEENSIISPDSTLWHYNEKAYLYLSADEKGFAKPISLLRYKPKKDSTYLMVLIGSTLEQDSIQKISYQLPFNRYYMDEFDAAMAEKIYLQETRDTHSILSASVSILHGKAVIKGLTLNGKPFKDSF